MKKALIVFVVLLLAVPAVSFAGSATSRWDLTIGGYVKLDVVHNTKAGGGIDVRTAPREDGTVDTQAWKAKTLNWGAAESRLNFAIKGPEALGAKTAAFIEGEFRGTTWSQQGGSFLSQQGGAAVNAAGTTPASATLTGANIGGGGTGTYGLFALRHAYFQMIWPKTTLLMGHTFQAWGTIPSLNILGFGENHMNKGWTRVPQIRITQAFTKNFTGLFAVQAPYDTMTSQNVTVNPGANSLVPDLVADFSYASDACGKIGPFNMKFGVGGFWGQDKFWWNGAATGAAASYNSKTIDKLAAGFYWYIPIIPQKKEGNRAGALGFTGQLYGGKGMGLPTPNYGPGGPADPTSWAAGNGAYTRSPLRPFINNQAIPGVSSVDANYYWAQGGWAQATFFLTNQWFVNGLYGIHVNRVSNAYVNSGQFASNVRNLQNYIFNVMYEPNPALRFAVEWFHVDNTYAVRSSAASNSHGSEDTFRFAGYYFF